MVDQYIKVHLLHNSIANIVVNLIVDWLTVILEIFIYTRVVL